MNDLNIEINASNTNNNNNNKQQRTATNALFLSNRDNEVDMQSPNEILGEEPDVVEMMDEDEEDDDEDDDDEENYQNNQENYDPQHIKHDSTNLLLDNNDNFINKSSRERERHSIDTALDYQARVDPDEDETDSLENEDRKRFQIELEFVQSLANPNYLNFLAQRGYFKNETFLNYLKYLMYWKKPEYCKYLMYPQCLSLLEMLQHEHFMKEIVNAACSKYIDEQILLIWIHYKTRRDWVRIDPTKIPDNIEKLFKKEGKSPEQQQQHSDNAASDDDCKSEIKSSAKNKINSSPMNDANNHHFHENHLSEKNPFSASFLIDNEKF
jgi:mediator of RNA polymerase II transcription subunit 31